MKKEFCVKCTLCKDFIDPEHPQVLYGINPMTFRWGWMDLFCYIVACEEAMDTPSKKNQYSNRYEEYLMEWC